MPSGNYNTTIGDQPFAMLREGQDTHQVAGTLRWLRGKHEFKFGGEWLGAPYHLRPAGLAGRRICISS
jgi:hypothetical protein